MQIEFVEDQPSPPRTRPLPTALKIIPLSAIAVSAIAFLALWPSPALETCYIDEGHELTWGLNREIACCAWKEVIGLGQVLMDLWILLVNLYWIGLCQNVRFPTAIFSVFLIRAVFLNTVKFPYPDHVIWNNPGFYTFTVPYDHTRDFFFSGHTTTIVLIWCELSLTRQPRFIIAAVALSTVYMLSMLVVVRVHYTIDIVGAIIYSVYMFGWVQEYLREVDWVWSLPKLALVKMGGCCRREEAFEMEE